MAPERILAVAATVVVIVSIIAGIALTGGPGAGRAERFDDERISNLVSISGYLEQYIMLNEEVPEDLSVLQGEYDFARINADPRTGEPYTYEKVGDRSFKLCAIFETEGPHMFTAVARLPVEFFGASRVVEPSAAEGPGTHRFQVTITQAN